MASLNNKYIVVERFIKPSEGEFETVQAIGDEVYRGKVVELPEIPIFLDNYQLKLGDVVIFAPHSPDTFLVEDKRFVKVEDLLKVE